MLMLKLVKPALEYKEPYIEMIKEWENTGEKIIPLSIRIADYNHFEQMIKIFEERAYGINLKPNQVPSTTLWGYHSKTGKIVGAVNIRHYLNESLLNNVGHIGDGVRPSERKKGYATTMLRYALSVCKEKRMSQVILGCYKDNLASAATIKKNGGILVAENENYKEGRISQYYSIKL
jgi:predicted acetyltransferase